MSPAMTSSQRRALRARAHGLHPVVGISQNGLSESVLAEIDRGLKAHELIKVRVYGIERNERESLLAEICSRLNAAPIQQIGNILVVYRENPDTEKAAEPLPRKPGHAAKPANPRRRQRE